MLVLKKNLLNIKEVVLIIVFLMPNKGGLYLALENIMLIFTMLVHYVLFELS